MRKLEPRKDRNPKVIVLKDYNTSHYSQRELVHWPSEKPGLRFLNVQMFKNNKCNQENFNIKMVF